MPFPKNWVEELIIEWLHLKGFLVLSNVRLKSGRKGGVKEADILGIKLLKFWDEHKNMVVEKLKIKHIEVGMLSQNLGKNLNFIMKKFSKDRIEAIKKIATDIIEVEESTKKEGKHDHSSISAAEIDYEPIYIATYVAKKQLGNLKKHVEKANIKLLHLDEVIEEIMRDINEWKEKQLREGFRVTRMITLPENLWLLNFLDYMAGYIRKNNEFFRNRK